MKIDKPGFFYDMPSAEEWRPISGYPGYEVSDHGRVRSIDRSRMWRHRDYQTGRMIEVLRRHRGKMLIPAAKASGHLHVSLGRGNHIYVHHLVLEAFCGPAPSGMECLHWDDNPANNVLSNLRWGTRAENHADYRRNYGTHQSARGQHV